MLRPKVFDHLAPFLPKCHRPKPARSEVDPNRTEAREGRYANHLEVGHNAEEVVMDFGQVFEGEPPLVHTRIVTHPSFAREMVEVLNESLERHTIQERRRKPRREQGSNR
jgi:hypothetical protein